MNLFDDLKIAAESSSKVGWISENEWAITCFIALILLYISVYLSGCLIYNSEDKRFRNTILILVISFTIVSSVAAVIKMIILLKIMTTIIVICWINLSIIVEKIYGIQQSNSEKHRFTTQ